MKCLENIKILEANKNKADFVIGKINKELEIQSQGKIVLERVNTLLNICEFDILCFFGVEEPIQLRGCLSRLEEDEILIKIYSDGRKLQDVIFASAPVADVVKFIDNAIDSEIQQRLTITE